MAWENYWLEVQLSEKHPRELAPVEAIEEVLLSKFSVLRKEGGNGIRIPPRSKLRQQQIKADIENEELYGKRGHVGSELGVWVWKYEKPGDDKNL
jgi:hypothetical protein